MSDLVPATVDMQNTYFTKVVNGTEMYGVFQIAYNQEVHAKTASGYKSLSNWYEAQTVSCPGLVERKFVNATTFFQGINNN